MKEIRSNIWNYGADWIFITTNGTLKNNGACVMGRGIAREAKTRHPNIDFELGKAIRERGNVIINIGPYSMYYDENTRSFQEVSRIYQLFSFPVKHNWWEKADIGLIKQSCITLRNMLKYCMVNSVALPRPGCGNGGLCWEKEVKPVIEKYFSEDERIMVFSK